MSKRFNATIATVVNVSRIQNRTTEGNVPASKEIDCDFVYNNYLQALMKQRIINETVDRSKEVSIKQLASERDAIFKVNLKLAKLEEEVAQLENLNTVKEAIRPLKGNLEIVNKLNRDEELNSNIMELIEIFKTNYNRIYLENIKSINQQGYDEMKNVLNSILFVVKNIRNRNVNCERIGKLAGSLKEFFELKDKVMGNVEIVDNLQSELAHYMFQDISDRFVN